MKDTHETGGGFGSVGYGCQWKREEASKNLLRTHTTAISSQVRRIGRGAFMYIPPCCTDSGVTRMVNVLLVEKCALLIKMFHLGRYFKPWETFFVSCFSLQMLYRLANQKGGFTPKRYFSIDRVFRNETMDATHLCEFHQVPQYQRICYKNIWSEGIGGLTC